MAHDFNFNYSTPEKQGMLSSALLDFIEELERERIEIHSLILMRHRHIVAEGYWAPFDQHQLHRLFSAGKAIVSTAILFAVQEKKLSLEDKLIDLFPESMPERPSEWLKKLSVYHLMTMQTGHATDTFGPMLESGVDRAKVFFEQELVYEPGTHFLYNNGVPDMLGILLYKLTGQSVYDYLTPRLFEPLGMKDMTVDKNGPLDELPTMCLRSRDFFKLTLFYADEGMWQGKQILAKELVRDAGAYLVPSLQRPEPPHVAYDTQFGYGYQIWRNSVGGYRLDGGRGQFGIVIPDMDIVAVINANEADQGIIPVLFWKHVTSQLYAKPIEENEEIIAQQQRLQHKLKHLTWLPVDRQIEGRDYSGSYKFEEAFCGCHQIDLEFENEGKRLVLTTDRQGKTRRAELEIGAWSLPSSVPFEVPELIEDKKIRLDKMTGVDPEQAVGSYVWLDDHTLEAHFRSNGWMGAHVFRFVFKERGLTITRENGTAYNMRHRSDITPQGLREQTFTDGVEAMSSSFVRNI